MLKSPLGLNVGHAKRVQSPRRDIDMPTSQKPGTSKAKESTDVSALAALHARQAQHAGASGTSGPSVRGDGKPHASTKAKHNVSDKDHERPASPSKVTKKAHSGPSTGKLPARKGGMFASTPMVASTAKRVEADEGDSGESDAAARHPAPTIEGARQPFGTGTPREANRRELPRAAKKDTAYDLSESPESVASDTKARSVRASRAAPERGKRGTKAKPASRGRARQSVEPPRRGRGVARRQNSQSTRSRSRRHSLKTRMMAESNSNAVEFRESSMPPPRKAQAVEGIQPTAEVGTIGAPRAANGRGETIDDFEESVVQYDRDGDDPDGGEVMAMSKPHQHSARNALDQGPRIEKETALTNARRDRNREAATAAPAAREQSSPKALPARKRQPSAALDDDIDLGPAPKRRMPNTPRVLGSSPPAATAAVEVMDKALSNKPSFVAFTKDGPLNQGTVSAKKSAPGSARTNRSSLPPPPPQFRPKDLDSAARLTEKMDPRSSRAAANVEPRRRSRTVTQANVADSVIDALKGFTKKVSIAVTHPPLKLNSTAVAVPQNEHQAGAFVQPEADDTGFMNIDDFDTPFAFMDEKAAFKRAGPGRLAERTRSQIAMPPPPAPKPWQITMPGRAPNTSLTGAAEVQTGFRDDSNEAKEGAKRPREKETKDQPVSERPRGSAAPSAEAAESSKGPAPADTEYHEQPKPVSSQRMQSQIPERATRNAQKLHRPVSHGSQKVDILGSPIPQGMTVGAKETVLGKYSQQSDLSSDNVVGDDVVAVEDASRARRKATVPAQELPPPSCQPELMSSNKKRKPSGPEQESQGIMKIGTTDTHPPVIQDPAREPIPDPFPSSGSSRTHPREGSTSSILLDNLRRQSQGETIVAVLRQPAKPQVGRKAVKPDREKPVRDQVEREVLSGYRQPSMQEDPDKTLVDDELEYQPRKRKRAPSLSTVSTDSDRSARAPRATHDDLGEWRNALQPHQANLFDELVIVSHRVVRYLVDKETAARDVEEDYGHRGLALVEQMELDQAREYQRFAQNLPLRRKQRRQEYIDYSDKLERLTAAIEAEWQERKKALTNREDYVERLQALLAAI